MAFFIFFSIITDLDNLNDKFRDYIQPFYSEDPRSTRDLLNLVKKAFVKAKVNELIETGATLCPSFAAHMIKQGVDEHIWTSDFNPSPDIDFQEYMQNRLKNERKSLNKKRMSLNTSERLASYIQQSLSQMTATVINNDEEQQWLMSDIIIDWLSYVIMTNMTVIVCDLCWFFLCTN